MGNSSSLDKHALVTGGAGFLGSHLVDRLLRAGCKVTVLDNFFTGSRDNLAHLAGNPALHIVKHDIVEPLELEVDEIYNLACPASPVHYQHDPIKTLKTSVLGALNMLELARRNKARIFQASTSEVYGDPLEHPQRESYWGHVNPIGIRSCYDEGKRCAETLIYDYRRQHGLDVRVVRIFNTYGPQMHPQDGRVVSNFIMQALQGDDITIYGNGNQTRSFCYVDDLIDGFLRVMHAPVAHEGPLNLGNPVEFTIRQLADLVLELTQSRSRLQFKPLPSDDPQQRRPDISAVQKYCGWDPKTPLRAGLERTIPYFKSKIA